MTLLSIRRDNDGQPLDRETLARIAPKLAELSQNVLLMISGRVNRFLPASATLVTLGALTALGRVQQLPRHIRFAQQNGLTREEIVEVFTHLAFYAGWPAAVSALECLQEE